MGLAENRDIVFLDISYFLLMFSPPGKALRRLFRHQSLQIMLKSLSVAGYKLLYFPDHE